MYAHTHTGHTSAANTLYVRCQCDDTKAHEKNTGEDADAKKAFGTPVYTLEDWCVAAFFPAVVLWRAPDIGQLPLFGSHLTRVVALPCLADLR